MNNLLRFVAILVMLVTSAAVTEAQQSAKVYRIGYLGNAAGVGPVQEQFRQRLRELGYSEGQNIFIEWRFSKEGSLSYTLVL